MSARQPPLLGFDSVGNLLLISPGPDMAARPSGKIAATEREVSGYGENEHLAASWKPHRSLVVVTVEVPPTPPTAIVPSQLDRL